MTTRVTIVTPSFNQAAYLEATLKSVLGQTYTDVEYIVMDGGSTDGSATILEQYRPRLAHLEIGPDKGQTDALAKGFELATGEILAWVNSDDLLEPRAVESAVKRFEADAATRFAYGDSAWIDAAGRLIKWKREIPFNWFVWLRTYNYIPQPSAFWRADLYREVGGLDRSFDLAMDTDMFARFAERTSPIHVREVWSRMRAQPDRKNVRLRERSDVEDHLIRSRYANPLGPRWAFEQIAAKAMRTAWRAAIGGYGR